MGGKGELALRRSERDQIFLAASFNHAELDALVKRHQPSAMLYRKREQVNIRYLLMALQAVPVEGRRVRDRNVVRPESVMATTLGGVQSAEHEGGALRRGVTRVGQDALATVFGQGASCSTKGVVREKPAARLAVPDMSSIEERHQETDIEQGPPQMPSSSMICCTNSTVTGGPPRRGSGCRPLRL